VLGTDGAGQVTSSPEGASDLFEPGSHIVLPSGIALLRGERQFAREHSLPESNGIDGRAGLIPGVPSKRSVTGRVELGKTSLDANPGRHAYAPAAEWPFRVPVQTSSSRRVRMPR
jgi:hypothetical protein